MGNGFAHEQIQRHAFALRAVLQELDAQHDKLCAGYREETYRRLAGCRDQAVDALSSMSLHFAELEQDALADYTRRLADSLTAFHLRLRDYSGLNRTMEGYLSRLAPYMAQGANAAALGRQMNRVKMGYYPTELSHVAKMQAALIWPEDQRVNLLDPCCGCGTALWALAAGRNAMTYGVELDKARAAQAIEKLDRAAIGSYYYSSVSQNAFHVLLLNPPYLAVSGTRAEKRFLASSYLHLVQGGVLLYIIPYYRMDSELCGFLSEHFCDLRMYRFQEQEFRRFRQVLVIGRRKNASKDVRTARRLLTLACDPEQIPTIDKLPEASYAIPRAPKTVSLFRGEEFNEQELAAELQKAGSILTRQSGLDGREQRPPLPLTISQIGLIGGSGLINGLIECDAPHIIKGRVIKVRNVKKENITDGQGRVIGENSTVTVSNQMVFNLLTPDGFQALT